MFFTEQPSHITKYAWGRVRIPARSRCYSGRAFKGGKFARLLTLSQTQASPHRTTLSTPAERRPPQLRVLCRGERQAPGSLRSHCGDRPAAPSEPLALQSPHTALFPTHLNRPSGTQTSTPSFPGPRLHLGSQALGTQRQIPTLTARRPASPGPGPRSPRRARQFALRMTDSTRDQHCGNRPFPRAKRGRAP